MRKIQKVNKLALIFLAIIIFLLTIWLKNSKTFAPEPKNNSSSSRVNEIKDNPNNGQVLSKTLDKNKYSISDPNSIWVVVNKKRPLDPTSFAPNDLVLPDIPLRNSNASSEMLVRKEVADSLVKMANDAKKESINLLLASGYRSYSLQVAVYNNFVKTQGQAIADTQSARPGHSEHQTGLAVDLGSTSRKCEIEDCFADMPEGKWLEKNSYKYGFILRYYPNGQPEVGYKYEPWHFRYVGIELATELHNKNIKSLEEYFNLPVAPDYN